MKKKFLNVALFALLLPLALFARDVAAHLPAPPEGVARAKYQSWSGVLRLWVCQEWQPGNGSLVPWLNACATAFEKRHPGVYVQVKEVSPGVMAAFHDGEVPAPDLVVFSPGLLEDGSHLFPIEGDVIEGDVLPALARCGRWEGEIRALPVAMGGYAWAWDARAAKALPPDWSQTDLALRAPPDDDGHSYSGALLAQCGGMGDVSRRETPPAGSGMDLGLPLSGPTPTPLPGPVEPVDCRLSPDFQRAGDAYTQFQRGDAAAIAVTQREIRRLQLLSDSGRGPQWEVAGGLAFTDQIALLGVVDWPREDIQARRELGNL